ncbi:hypothetical protein CYMTET_39020 [Cymbomonas tetramitiformis]|uniref:SMP-LTD domain-containing protein n=1 Tax=Cymbomonas tetramitiformis TaxID=36881 RepID=A0AAE0F524_9CHLO|nr:hypothetical protein CYMTET_39020 [Cymbomonas tetramitiformis]
MALSLAAGCLIGGFLGPEKGALGAGITVLALALSHLPRYDRVKRGLSRTFSSLTPKRKNIYFPHHFQDSVQLEFLNQLLVRFWSRLASGVDTYFRNTVEAMVEAQLPTNMRGFRFQNINLGEHPLRIVQAGIQNHVESSVELVLDLDYCCDATTTCNVRWRSANSKTENSESTVSGEDVIVTLSGLKLKGRMHLMLKPTLPCFPFAGAVTMHFLDQPQISFELEYSQDISERYLLKNILTRALDDTIAQLLVTPNNIYSKLSDQVDFFDTYALPTGFMHYQCLSGSFMEAHEKKYQGEAHVEKPDIYVTTTVGATVSRTPTCLNTTQPIWDFSDLAGFVLYDTRQSCQIKVYDESAEDDVLLGETVVPCGSLGGSQESPLRCKGVLWGDIAVRAELFKLSANPSLLEQHISYAYWKRQAVLVILVDSASGLCCTSTHINVTLGAQLPCLHGVYSTSFLGDTRTPWFSVRDP